MPDVTAAPSDRWSVVVPVKRLDVAKSRLGLPDAARAELALAMALDTVAAALACDRVGLVVAVTDDPAAAPALRGLGATVVPDVPDAGLDAALLYGARVAAVDAPTCGVAALAADLPALRPGDLARALDAAAQHAVALVSDAAGTGTTLLTAAVGATLPVAFGAGSRDRHVAAGAVELDVSTSTLRRDVDTLADLAGAAAAGLGPRTAAAIEGLGLVSRLAAT
jgi:2-phospho-L-lactate guanylyltransferase